VLVALDRVCIEMSVFIADIEAVIWLVERKMWLAVETVAPNGR
jgi:hypothetical protein